MGRLSLVILPPIGSEGRRGGVGFVKSGTNPYIAGGGELETMALYHVSKV